MEIRVRSKNHARLCARRFGLTSVIMAACVLTTMRSAAAFVLPTPIPKATPAPVTLYMPGSNYYGGSSTGGVAAYTLSPSGLLTLAGVIGNNNPQGVAVDSKGRIYVLNENASISIYASNSDGDATPLAQISGGKTELFSQVGPRGIAVDHSGYIYVTSGESVLIFAPGSNGNVAPFHVIAGPDTRLCVPNAIAVSGANLYVENGGNGVCSNFTTTVYALGASGNVRPVATIPIPGSMALDSKGNIYITNDNTIFEFGPLKGNNTSQMAAIVTGGNFLLEAIAVDAAGNIQVAANDGVGDAILFYPAGSNGTVAPSAILRGSNTDLISPEGLAIDQQGNLYVANSGGGSGGVAGNVTVYASGSIGNTAPARTITSADTGIFQADGVAVDGSGNVYVSSASGSGFAAGGVSVFPAGRYGAVPPSARIFGPSTGLHFPEGVAVDGAGNVYVQDEVLNSTEVGGPTTVKIFAAGSTGDVAPLTNLPVDTFPATLAVDAAGNVYVRSSDSIAVYASGGTSPVAQIPSPQSTDLEYGGAGPLAVNSLGGIYTVGQATCDGCSFQVLEFFAPGSNDNSSPARVLGGSRAMLAGFADAVDASGTIYDIGYGELRVFSARSSGNVPPISISGIAADDAYPHRFLAVSPPATP